MERRTGSQDIRAEFEVRSLTVMFRGLHRGISKRNFFVQNYILNYIIVSRSSYLIRFELIPYVPFYREAAI